jgi:hypothetical protein
MRRRRRAGDEAAGAAAVARLSVAAVGFHRMSDATSFCFTADSW